MNVARTYPFSLTDLRGLTQQLFASLSQEFHNKYYVEMPLLKVLFHNTTVHITCTSERWTLPSSFYKKKERLSFNIYRPAWKR